MTVHAHPRRQESRIVARTRFQPSCRPAQCPLQLGRMSTATLSHGVPSCLFSARNLAYTRRNKHFPKSASYSRPVGACSCSVSKLNVPICTPCRESPIPCTPRAQCGQPSILADPTRGCIHEQGTYMHPPHGRFRTAISPSTLEGRRRNTTAPTTARLASGATAGSGMRRANGRKPSRDQRATAYTAEQRETLRRGLRILARIIARSHLRRQESRSEAAPRQSAEDEG